MCASGWPVVSPSWGTPGRVKYGSRALSRSAIQSRAGLFQSVSIFARETNEAVCDLWGGVREEIDVGWVA